MASTTITKSLASDVAGIIANMGGVTIESDNISSGGGSTQFSGTRVFIIVGSSTANNAIFQCWNNVVVTHTSSGSSITCAVSGTTYTVTNNSTAAARFIAFIAN